MPLQLETDAGVEEYKNYPIPLPSRSFGFRVKAAKDAYIILSLDSQHSKSTPFIEIFIGGWNNKQSAIRRNGTKPDKQFTETLDILSPHEFRGFWITHVNGHIVVGKENEVKPFLTWREPEPINFKWFGVRTGQNTCGEWSIFDPVAEAGQMPSNVKWVRGAPGVIPEGAVQGGFNPESGETLFVGRAQHSGSMVPGSVVTSKGVCQVPWGGVVHSVVDYEVLTVHNVTWVNSQNGDVPHNALEGGKSEKGTTLYIGRVRHNNGLFIGKVQPSDKVCYFPWGGKEVASPEYEVLVQT